MSDPFTTLGLSCPVKGKFYICQSAKVRFVGCCTVDPCADGSGVCPSASLAPSSFSGDSFVSIPPESCGTPLNASSWFTCQKTSPPFLGCCTVNPCATGSCPTANLHPARLSDDPAQANIFLTNLPPNMSTTATPSPTATPSASGAPVAAQPGLSTGAIAGIAVGAVGLVALVIGAILLYKCGWNARRRREKRETALMQQSQPSGWHGGAAAGGSGALVGPDHEAAHHNDGEYGHGKTSPYHDSFQSAGTPSTQYNAQFSTPPNAAHKSTTSSGSPPSAHPYSALSYQSNPHYSAQSFAPSTVAEHHTGPTLASANHHQPYAPYPTAQQHQQHQWPAAQQLYPGPQLQPAAPIISELDGNARPISELYGGGRQ